MSTTERLAQAANAGVEKTSRSSFMHHPHQSEPVKLARMGRSTVAMEAEFFHPVVQVDSTALAPEGTRQVRTRASSKTLRMVGSVWLSMSRKSRAALTAIPPGPRGDPDGHGQQPFQPMPGR